MRESQYFNLNEGIVEIFDEGFDSNDHLSTKIALYDYRTNEEFPRDSATAISYDNNHGNKFIPKATLFPFGGNELMILRVHDAIRNNKVISYSFVHQFNKDFIKNHFFALREMVFINGVPLYHLSFQAKKWVAGITHRASGDVFIERNNFAIHKLEYSMFEKDESKTKLVYKVVLEYSRFDSLMRLNYISLSNLFQVRDPKDFRVTDVVLDRNVNAFKISFNAKPESRSALNIRNYQFKLQDAELKIKNVKLSPTEDEVFVYITENPKSKMNPVRLSSMLSAQVKNVKSIDGRAVNMPTYIEVDQFRELFVQKVTFHKKLIGDSLLMDKNRALFPNSVKTDSLTDVSGFWMNTPLKK